MPRVAVVKPFTLSRDDGTRHRYEVGMHSDMPVEDANHWYAKLHIAEESDLPTVMAAQSEDHAVLVDAHRGLTEKHEQTLAELQRLQEENRRLSDAHAEGMNMLAAAQDRAVQAETKMEIAPPPADATTESSPPLAKKGKPV